MKNKTIKLKSVITGKCIWFNENTKYNETWEYEDIKELPMSEVSDIFNNNPVYFTEPYLLILDDEVVSNFGLTELYQKFYQKEINDVLANEKKLGKFLQSCNPNKIQLLIDVLKEKLKSNEFNYFGMMKCVENFLKDNSFLELELNTSEELQKVIDGC